MKLFDNITIIDVALKIDDVLVISDVHIGYEEALNKQGIMLPRTQFDETYAKLKTILETTKPNLVVINGDLKHEFGTISETEWRQTLRILDLILSFAKKIVLVKGNHDTILGPIARKRDIEIVEQFIYGDVAFVHGNIVEKMPAKVKTIVIGHEHPAISIGTETRKEKYKCFLVGRWKGKKLIVMPSFNPLVEGADILQEKALSPYLDQNINDFSVYIVEDKVYDFGKIKKIKEKF